MAINVSFQNINQANSEILKAFNSANSAKALEAYQPLSARQRKSEKLRALQILKSSSESSTLQDISLNTDTLSVALQSAEGATLQAMLNLLSAKMIEQNKYTYFDEEEQSKLKDKVQEKLEEHKERKEQEEQQEEDEEEDKLIGRVVDAAVTYYKEMQEAIIERYKKVLSAFSLENLRKVLDKSLKFIVKYTYEVPLQSFNEYVVQPIDDFSDSLRKQIDSALDTGLEKSSKLFSPKEIKSMLQESFAAEQERKLENTVISLEENLKARYREGLAKKKFSSKEIKLALHN